VRNPFRHLALALALIPLAAAGRLAAQEPPDSLTARVRRAEEAIEQLQARLAEQTQAAVRSRSRGTLEVYGLIVANGFYNSAKTNNSDIPAYADTLTTAESASRLPMSNVGATVRQSRLGLQVSAVRALGAQVSGHFQFDFVGGQQPSAAGRTSPLMRVRIASIRMDWAHVGLLIGQDWTLLAPQTPTSYAAMGVPLFGYSGNLWFRAPQVRLTAETSWKAHLGIQAAVLAPMQPLAQGAVSTQPDSAERSGRPTVEGRAYLAWGTGDLASEIGVAGHAGWLATGGDSLLQSEAVSLDGRVALGAHLVISGEAFSGQALGAFAGGVAQNLGLGGVPVRAQGGWVQVDIRPRSGWQVGGGYGIDDPNDEDLLLSGRGRNVTYAAHLIWRPGGGLMLGTEWRRTETTYARGTLAVNHINSYAGLSF
jgi:hypothetical protein